MPTRGPDDVTDTASAEGAPSLAARTIAGLRTLATQHWLLSTADLHSLTDAVAHAAQVFALKDARVAAAVVHEDELASAAAAELVRLVGEDSAAPDEDNTPAPTLTLDDVGPLLAQAGYRHAADALLRVNRYLRGEERIARSCSRLKLGLHGRTRLAAAARVGDVDRCAFLVAHGADVLSRDGFGRSALSEAVAGGHGACAAWLRGEGAEEDVAWGGVRVATWGGAGGAGGGVDQVRSLSSVSIGLLAVGHHSGALRLLDTATGAVTASLQGHTSIVSSLVSLPGGKLASGSLDCSLRLWDVTTGVCEAVIDAGQLGIYSLAVLRDGRLASGGFRSVRLWDVATRAHTAELQHASTVSALAALPCGGVAAGCADGTIALWSAVGVRMETLGGGAGIKCVNALTLLPDGRLAAGHGSFAEDHVVRVWDLQRRVLDVVLTGHRFQVSAPAALSDGRLLSSSWDGTLKVWGSRVLLLRGCASTAQCAATLPAPGVLVIGLTVLPDGRVVSGHYDGAVRVWR